MRYKDKLQPINEYEWLLPKAVRKEMNVNGKLIANKAIYDAMEDGAIEQLSNVCCLPGVIGPVVALPDAHFGYGLPMGAVAAFDAEEGIISSGLCGFDINCGVNSIRTNLPFKEVQEKIKELISALYNNVPVGVGSKGKLRLTNEELDKVLIDGCEWAVEKGYGVKEDLKHIEENGKMEGADPNKVSGLAKKRGLPQLGTLGAGNHFLEVQKITDVFDEKKAKEWGIKDKDQVIIMLHCGSRGLGHQVATDYLQIQEKAVQKYNIWLPDRQLACAPANSKEGQDYFAAMKCAVNYSFTNRLVMTQWIRETFQKVFSKDWESMDMHTVAGICHNVMKKETHTVDGKKKELYVHRKGATRSFPDQPVLLAGSMGTSSYILKGTETAMQKTFGSSAHGAGRAMSRHGAINQFRGNDIINELASRGIVAKAPSPKSIAEEAPKAYKDVEEVINTVHNTGISLKVIRMEPMGVIKG
ncbi:MAG: RtcB family protein [Nanoarchaeota archaeon]|nr:RtcB family protein [Nanoarchaeota archaeon]MBU1004594.1 RtcB family protein [Nanoarchaeota archaeon]MBU1946980.1 RtcB family protein [Nanoarchaeota archaeon]